MRRAYSVREQYDEHERFLFAQIVSRNFHTRRDVRPYGVVRASINRETRENADQTAYVWYLEISKLRKSLAAGRLLAYLCRLVYSSDLKGGRSTNKRLTACMRSHMYVKMGLLEKGFATRSNITWVFVSKF